MSADEVRTVPRLPEEHAQVVLAAILPSSVRRLDIALRHLTPQHILNAELRYLFELADRYVELAGALPSTDALVDLLGQKFDAATVLYYKELHSRLSSTEVSDGDFRWSLQQLREMRAEMETGEVLTTALNILRNGHQRGKEFLSGHEDARSFIVSGMAEVEAALQLQDAPEGDVRHEQKDILQDYADAKQRSQSGREAGVLTGVRELDEVTGGLQAGELSLVVAYSSEGKTGFVVQVAWRAAVVQGLNVYFATSETLRAQVRRKLVARHSVQPMFEMPQGLNTRDLKAGTLQAAQEAKMVDVVQDLTNNSAYGKLHVAQIPRGSTIDTLAARVRRANAQWEGGVDLLVIDYIPLLHPLRPRQNQNVEMSDTVKQAKIIAATFDDGRGLPIVSPWQVSRAAWDLAASKGGYTMSALAETSEAEKSSDLLISMLRASETALQRQAEVKVQVLKNRDGERLEGAQVSVDYATCTFESLQPEGPASRLEEQLFDDSSEFDALL